MSEQPRKLMRVVIKEEFVDLTGDAISALLLNQCIYWSEIINEMDQETLKKIESYEKVGAMEKATQLRKNLRDGWFWKTAKDFHKEIMISSRGTVDRKLKELEKSGYIQCKKPEIRYKNGKTDNTNRYKVNLEFIQKELLQKGYSLEGYTLPESQIPKSEQINKPASQSNAQNEQGKKTLFQSNAQNEQRFAHHEQMSAHHEQTLTEIIFSKISLFDDDDYILNIARGNSFYIKLAYFFDFKEIFNNQEDYLTVIKKLIEYKCVEFTKSDIKEAFNDLTKNIERVSSPPSFFAKALSNQIKKAKITKQRTAELEEMKLQRESRDTSFYYNWLEEEAQ